MTTITLIGGILALWVLGNLVGWLSVQGHGNRPFNWRVLTGPPLYYRWIDRRALANLAALLADPNTRVSHITNSISDPHEPGVHDRRCPGGEGHAVVTGPGISVPPASRCSTCGTPATEWVHA